jgi:AraC family transcriptional regulator of adaptative response/methylated-DNA-[protein]-cysteine methyltransferase
MENQDYQRIETAIRFLEAHALEQPSLDEVAEHIGLSPFHFQRLFKRWAGVSPKRFLQYLTVESAKQLLQDSVSVLETSYEVGLSGPGRLHDLFVNVDAMTPGEYKQQGKGIEIRYAFHETPFGECLAAETDRGICFLGFVTDGDRAGAIDDLQGRWKEALLANTPGVCGESVQQIFSSTKDPAQKPVQLFLSGTNFQLKVWEALLKIPEGAVISYGDLANNLGKPNAHRAVGTAVGQNPISYLIPCHRVLRASGDIGGYHWGVARKKAILAQEAIKRDASHF